MQMTLQQIIILALWITLIIILAWINAKKRKLHPPLKPVVKTCLFCSNKITLSEGRINNEVTLSVKIFVDENNYYYFLCPYCNEKICTNLYDTTIEKVKLFKDPNDPCDYPDYT